MFLTQGVARGATVVVLGAAPDALCDALATAAGPSGLLVVCRPDPGRRCSVAARIRASPAAAPIASHIVDVLVLATVPPASLEAVADEARRLLAPRGELRAIVPCDVEDTDTRVRSVSTALAAAFFRAIEVSPVAGAQVYGIRARGPR